MEHGFTRIKRINTDTLKNNLCAFVSLWQNFLIGLEISEIKCQSL